MKNIFYMKTMKEKNKIGKISLFATSLVLAFVFFGNVALAVDKIDVEYPVGTNLNGDNIFDAENILPGWEESKTIRVKNRSTTDDTNLYFKFNLKGDKKLAKKLKLYVISVADNNYRIGGSGDRWTLKEADDKSLYVDKLSTGERKKYKIRIKFDESAGNEYQGLEAKFNIDFTIESENAGSGTEAEILASEGRVVTGNAEITPTPVGGVQGEEASREGSGEIAGTENQCQSWPKWIWILALVIFAGVLGIDARNKYQDEDFGWKFPAFWTAVAIAFWYFFDKCREYSWFWYCAIIIAIVSQFIFLYFLKKKAGKTPELEEVKDAEVKEPEESKID